jgi:hypothetical protein
MLRWAGANLAKRTGHPYRVIADYERGPCAVLSKRPSHRRSSHRIHARSTRYNHDRLAGSGHSRHSVRPRHSRDGIRMGQSLAGEVPQASSVGNAKIATRDCYYANLLYKLRCHASEPQKAGSDPRRSASFASDTTIQVECFVTTATGRVNITCYLRLKTRNGNIPS